MHTKLAARDVETFLPEGEFIYSRTDLNGIVVEANQAFANVSAYEREEMIGQPHNLVRHPDMPDEAFTDLWRDLRAGRPWRGLVKNRRKDGGYYWVVANASPVREGGRVVGYQSIRTSPSRDEINGAEDAYRRLRNGDSTIRIRHGRIVGRRRRLLEKFMSFNTQVCVLSLLALLASLSTLALGVTQTQAFRLVASVFCILSFLCSAVFLTVIVPVTRKQLQSLADHMDYVLATGDLTRRFSLARHDVFGEFSRHFDVLVSSFQATMQGIGDAASQVGKSTRDVSAGVHQVTLSAMVQGEATASAAAAVEEVTVAIAEVASHAATTRETAVRSRDTARRGAEQSSTASSTAQALAATVQAAALQVKELGRRSSEISRITGVISEIANQTNLLALNAAIEAARAGEAGRGFAVVADEVRKLAERTGNATQEIASLVTAIAGETERAVLSMETGAGHVDASVSLVVQAKCALDEINEEMAKTLEMVSEISHATAEQRNAMSALSSNVNRVTEMTDRNVSAVSDTKQLTMLLDRTVDRMMKAVGQYLI